MRLDYLIEVIWWNKYIVCWKIIIILSIFNFSYYIVLNSYISLKPCYYVECDLRLGTKFIKNPLEVSVLNSWNLVQSVPPYSMVCSLSKLRFLLNLDTSFKTTSCLISCPFFLLCIQRRVMTTLLQILLLLMWSLIHKLPKRFSVLLEMLGVQLRLL